MSPTSQLNLPPTEVKAVNRDRLTPVNSVDREREWLALVLCAMGRSGLSMTAMAIDMGVSLPLLSAQLSGGPHKHVSWARMGRLSPQFWHELVLLIVAFHGLQIGLSEIDRRDLELGRTLREAVARSLGR